MEKYIKVEIKSENDLPKVDGDYIVHSKSYGWTGQANWKNFENANYPEYNQYLWLLNYDWYLKPISDTELIVPSIEDCIVMAEKHFPFEKAISTNTHGDDYNRPKIYGFKIGANWAISEIKKLNN